MIKFIIDNTGKYASYNDMKILYDATIGSIPSSLLTDLFLYWKLDEASGNAIDSLGVYTGVSTTVIYGSPGIINNCFTFSAATGSAVNVASTGTVSTARSYSLWGKRGTIAYNKQFINDDTGFWGFFLAPNGDITMTDGSGTTIATWAGVWTDTTIFHHLVFLISGVGISQSVELYFDNGSEGAQTVDTSDMIFFCIGINSGSIGTDNYAFDGGLDEVGIWTKVLTVSEIATLYNSGNGITYPFS